MTHLQKLAHARLLATLPVRTHIRMSVKEYEGNKLTSKEASEVGRKGRVAAGLVIPEFKTLRQHMTDKRRRFNGKIK